ncbi:Ferrous iron transport periplasmic protein EfeO, contains peptidase-M75 domain and (frequently) cupredoxin-like domain [Leucobacter sp. 7(1)]|uniref:iron uptake system protein EfeO n=1 Tax=Leucobacter sp. 7(1) TaxID=1255613 RepID=UPI00097F1036|nr:iron uptake system protein EfeO [Leucobacter sp. 7(1)]SJN09532.1 Ferrous iron transport periplasmic protein EfeO, contains peptidase-M75 domain and (frequently) cupredoxin-like domain [Leucobacter sp. 7(1)]
MQLRPPLTLAALVVAGALTLTGCVPNAGTGSGAATALTVDSGADSCAVSAATAPSGPITFTVTNSGDKVTEFYVLAENELSIVGEVENIAPGSSRDLTLVAQPGDYFTVCKPGMVGAGIGQTPFTVTGETVAANADDAEAEAAAVASYTAYVKSQAAELLPQVEAFVAAYTAGDDAEARRLFPLARVSYERIEPTAEQFGDLDPSIDYRKPGAEAEGLPFTGFHRIEMDLWLDAAQQNYPDEAINALTSAERVTLGEQLVTDITSLYDLVHSEDFTLTLSDITNGAIGLLDEIAAPDGKLPGEENEFAHTDLYDFTANVEGAQVAYESVREIAASKGAEGAELTKTLDAQFAGMLELLAEYGDYEAGFVDYSTVDQAARGELGAQLNALSEPLSQLTHTVLGVSAE